ncbi:MAG: DNA-3-methyladenine glycosylase [Deltaproteobacteria bacterium]|nr:DNA-3-methyladenine glycosylase [Deltaproteobacteria bacterium]
MMVDDDFFARDACEVAKDLIGKVLRRRTDGLWLSAAIVETEAYYMRERASHASLGRTPSREALFAPPGTIYMYYARGGDSLNVSCLGDGDAVLIKAGMPQVDAISKANSLERMRVLNPGPRGQIRADERLCGGQTLLARALGLRVPEWNGQRFRRRLFYVDDIGYRPLEIIETPRIGIPAGRDEHLMYRFVDASRAQYATPRALRREPATDR